MELAILNSFKRKRKMEEEIKSFENRKIKVLVLYANFLFNSTFQDGPLYFRGGRMISTYTFQSGFLAKKLRVASYELRVTIYYELLFTYELRVAIYGMTYKLVLHIRYELLFTA